MAPSFYFRLLSAPGIGYIVLMTSTSDQNGQAQPSVPAPDSGRCTAESVADSAPILDERLEEKDLMFSIEVQLHDQGGKLGSFTMERLLKLEAKLGPAPQSERIEN